MTAIPSDTHALSARAQGLWPRGRLPGWLDRRVRFTPQERVQFTSQMAMMIGAGVAVSGALRSIARQCHRPLLRETLDRVNDDVLGGASVSAALSKHPGLFDKAYVATVAAGEASGRLQEVLTRLAEMQRSELRLQRTLRAMMVYPVMLTSVSLVVVATLVVLVLPRFAEIFDQYDMTLPLVTRGLMGLADELRSHWWAWGPLVIGVVMGGLAFRASPRGRRAIDTALLAAPMAKKVVQSLIGAKACGLLGLLVVSGVPLLESLRLLRESITNTLFVDLIDELEDAVTNGKSLSDALEGNEVLPPSAAEMIATSEETGRLGEVAQMIGAHYEEEGQAAAKQLVSAIEPLVTIVMGGVVATVVLAVMLPVFDIATITNR